MLVLKIIGRSITHRVVTMPTPVFIASNLVVLENFVRELRESGGFFASTLLFHNLRDVFFVEVA